MSSVCDCVDSFFVVPGRVWQTLGKQPKIGRRQTVMWTWSLLPSALVQRKSQSVIQAGILQIFNFQHMCCLNTKHYVQKCPEPSNLNPGLPLTKLLAQQQGLPATVLQSLNFQSSAVVKGEQLTASR